MRHFCQVTYDGVPVDVFSKSQRNLVFWIGECGIFKELPQYHGDLFIIGNLNTDSVLAGNRGENIDALSSCGTSNVRLKLCNPADPQPLAWINFVSSNGWSTSDVTGGNLDVKVFKGLDNRILRLDQQVLVGRFAIALILVC